MIVRILFQLFLLIYHQIALAQNPPPAQVEPNQPEQPAPPPSPEFQMMEDVGDGSDLIMKKNNFIYDGNDGRDPFKIYRELPVFSSGPVQPGPGSKLNDPNVALKKNIQTAIIPGEIIVQGILFRKNDPIVLVAVRGVRGLNQLKLNSPIGRNEGKIIEIHKDRIVIEQVKDFDGQKFTEKLILKVREKKN